jgi:hypothetical protein
MRPWPLRSWGIGKATPIISAIAPAGSCVARKFEQWDILFTKSYTDGAIQGESLDIWRDADADIHQGAIRYVPSVSASQDFDLKIVVPLWWGRVIRYYRSMQFERYSIAYYKLGLSYLKSDAVQG